MHGCLGAGTDFPCAPCLRCVWQVQLGSPLEPAGAARKCQLPPEVHGRLGAGDSACWMATALLTSCSSCASRQSLELHRGR